MILPLTIIPPIDSIAVFHALFSPFRRPISPLPQYLTQRENKITATYFGAGLPVGERQGTGQDSGQIQPAYQRGALGHQGAV